MMLTTATGCIAAPAHDMGAYVRKIASRGRGPDSNLMSTESFELFAKRNIKDKDFDLGRVTATASLWRTSTATRCCGHRGMVSFMSSMAIDIDAVVGALASINAQQEYRSTPVVKYTLQFIRSRIEGDRLLRLLSRDVATIVAEAADYVGVFAGPGGHFEFLREGGGLFLLYEGRRVALERLTKDDQFYVPEARFARFPLIFRRKPSTRAKRAKRQKVPWSR